MRNKKPLLLLLMLFTASTSVFGQTELVNMKVNGLANPLGIDTARPVFSWQVESSGRGYVQQSYSINVMDDEGRILWQSGTIDSATQSGIEYAGAPLESCKAYVWTLTVVDTNGETATSSSSFETAFMNPSEWTAKWIHSDGVNYQTLDPFVIDFDTPVDCRYVRLNMTQLGLRPSSDSNYSYAQLSEIEIYAGDTNVALTASFTASNSWSLTNYGWDLSYINDGQICSSRNGWTTTQNPSTPITLTADLGSVQHITQIKLYPRQNDHALGKASNIAASFPTAFTIQTSTDNKDYVQNFAKDAEQYHVPYFGKTFTVPEGKNVSRARIYASALGIFTMTLNGQPVTTAVLEPGESEYDKTILYSTYDVTPLITTGRNQILARVAGGIYNIEYLDDRYSKGEIYNYGETGLLTELLIEYTDGTSERIVTDATWHTALSPTLGSNWWGGEDFDARCRLTDEESEIDNWDTVTTLDNPIYTCPNTGMKGFGTLRSRMHEPLRIVEEWKAVGTKTIQSGGYTLRMIDFGRNFAGQYRFRLKGNPGQTITLRCGESLNPDGSVFIQDYYARNPSTYDTYTFAGDEDGEEWGPEFMYHGFRYLQIIGLDELPDASAFTAMRIRSDMDNIGTVETSNDLINQIHVICRDAIASQLYNTITDCPHREKLGWLDVPNEMYVSLNMNFDMQNFYKKVVLDCFDSQQADGRVPSIAPYYMNVFGDDTNWGGAAILVPYRNWRYYGDTSLMTEYYPQMKRLLQHYTANTTNYIINNSFSTLSDWGQESAGVNPSVPTEFTETTTYYYIVRAMAEIATYLGQSTDAATYTQLADNIKTAFNAKFYNAETATYTSVSGGGGRQSEQAQPLYYGLVPEGDEQRVADVLAARVKNDGYKVKAGEIALKCVFMSLAQYGYNDIVWQMAKQTDCPSYGYWVQQGYTTSPEYWNVSRYSQNHCMMDHIEEWFYTQLAGIQNTGSAFDTFKIAPYIPDDLNHADISTASINGTIRSSWQRTSDGYRFQFSIPTGTQATILLPAFDKKVLTENGTALTAGSNGIVSIDYGTEGTRIVALSGNYTWELSEDNGISDGIQAIDNSHPSSATYDLSGRTVAPFPTATETPLGFFIRSGKKYFNR